MGKRREEGKDGDEDDAAGLPGGGEVRRQQRATGRPGEVILRPHRPGVPQLERPDPLTADDALPTVSPFLADHEGVAGDPLPGASSGEASRGRGAGPGLPSGRTPVVLLPRRPRGVGMNGPERPSDVLESRGRIR